jgi:hypothetical protein
MQSSFLFKECLSILINTDYQQHWRGQFLTLVFLLPEPKSFASSMQYFPDKIFLEKKVNFM